VFLTDLELRADPAPDMWVVSAPLIWSDETFGRIVVPRGFRTDLASTPLHLGADGISRRPAAVHDWLYASARKHGFLDKAAHDDFLRASLRTEGAGWIVAAVFYYGVHWFGRRAWNSDAGALESRDFDTPENYAAWLKSVATA
jgi:Protein of unknown function (DUF1353)